MDSVSRSDFQVNELKNSRGWLSHRNLKNYVNILSFHFNWLKYTFPKKKFPLTKIPCNPIHDWVMVIGIFKNHCDYHFCVYFFTRHSIFKMNQSCFSYKSVKKTHSFLGHIIGFPYWSPFIRSVTGEDILREAHRHTRNAHIVENLIIYFR